MTYQKQAALNSKILQTYRRRKALEDLVGERGAAGLTTGEREVYSNLRQLEDQLRAELTGEALAGTSAVDNSRFHALALGLS